MSGTVLVREALAAVLERKEYLLPTARNVGIREGTKTLLQAIIEVKNANVFDEIAESLVSSIQSVFPTSTSATERVREKVLSAFHAKRISELEGIWQDFFVKLGLQKPLDPMISQFVNQTLFDGLAMKHFGAASHASPPSHLPSTSLTFDEENILRYVSGYIPFKLLRQFEKLTTDKAADFVECLSHMAVPGDCVEDDFPTYATKWIQQVNRGGLFVVNDQAFALFRQIEIDIRDTLPNLLGPNFTSESQQKDMLVSQVTATEEIQLQWALLAVDIDDDNDAQELLRLIVNLWITIRAHALAKSWIEVYRSTKKSTSKAKGLQKSLKKTET